MHESEKVKVKSLSRVRLLVTPWTAAHQAPPSMLVDFANRMARSGLPADQAVVEAGRRRIRPIVMTALATILGLLPLALGFGEGNETMVPLARAVVGGLLVSTMMTLLVVPILHSLVLAREQQAHHRTTTPSVTSEEI